MAPATAERMIFFYCLIMFSSVKRALFINCNQLRHCADTKRNLYFFTNYRSLKKSDEGMYECQVNASPMLRFTIYLNVVGKYHKSIINGGLDMIFIIQTYRVYFRISSFQNLSQKFLAARTSSSTKILR